MAMSTIFRNRGDDNVVTYSFDDIIAGYGYITLYPTKLGSAGNMIMSGNTMWGQPYQDDNTTTGAADFQIRQQYDFDLEMKQQTIIEGKAFINVPIYARNHGTANDTPLYVKTIVAKWDGSTETVISTDHQSATQSHASSTWFMYAASAEIARTVFKVGEYLRLNVELWENGTEGNGIQLTLSFNPSNSTKNWDTTGDIPSRMTALFPIKIVR